MWRPRLIIQVQRGGSPFYPASGSDCAFRVLSALVLVGIAVSGVVPGPPRFVVALIAVPHLWSAWAWLAATEGERSGYRNELALIRAQPRRPGPGALSELGADWSPVVLGLVVFWFVASIATAIFAVSAFAPLLSALMAAAVGGIAFRNRARRRRP